MLKYTVKKGDSLWSIVSQYGLYPKHKAIDNIIIGNKLWRGQYLIPGTVLDIPLTNLYYQVKSGDSLWSVAKKFNIPINTLISYNNIYNPYLIYPGTKIYFTKSSFNPSLYMVCIDPGHQAKANYDKEPNSPDSSIMKTKVSSGTQGSYTGKPEYEVDLEIGLKLRDILEVMGYNVIMTRETNDVNLSNIDRAKIANSSGANICIRIHAHGSDNTAANGVSVLYPAKDSPNTTKFKFENSKALAEYLLEGMVKETGAQNRGTLARNDITGFNFSTIPVVFPEVGFMTNKEEDIELSTDIYQFKLAEGMAEGVNRYFLSKLT